MTTRPVFREDAYQREVSAGVTALTKDGSLVVDASVFYPTGGGQPGDSGELTWSDGALRVVNTVKGAGDTILLIPEAGAVLPRVGQDVQMKIDWDRRYNLMRVHTALRLLSVAVPFGVTGGSISEGRGRLDFDMADPPEDKEGIAGALNAMIAMDAPVTEDWITDAELDAQPDLVKTMSVKPPRGSGRIRLIRIGDTSDPIDLQPCGGTHVRRTGEIGRVRLGKVEKKGRMNRRVYLHLDS